ncbi:MAG: ATPase [Clostridia bacterium]|nr:ATPase [Clostridia bacterium]NCC42787.1 ATPase [Clostridia bacterium]
MEPIIDKLSEIETAAARIMESAMNETKQQDKKADERTAEFDAQVEAATQKKLEELRSNLQKESVAELEGLKNSMEKALENMDNHYKQNHEKITDEIYHKIIRM